MSTNIDQRLADLGVTLPEAPIPAANYLPAVITGNLLFVSGQLPMRKTGVDFIGHIGDDVSIESGQEAAKLCAINILAQAKNALGTLDRVTRIVKLTGYVASPPDFQDQPKVINGASNFFAEVFGDKGHHARAAIGVASLPLGAAVEIEAILEFI